MLRLIVRAAIEALMISGLVAVPLLIPIVVRWMIDRHVDRWVRIHLLPEVAKERIS